jgi:hypothetical protein
MIPLTRSDAAVAGNERNSLETGTQEGLVLSDASGMISVFLHAGAPSAVPRENRHGCDEQACALSLPLNVKRCGFLVLGCTWLSRGRTEVLRTKIRARALRPATTTAHAEESFRALSNTNWE